MDHPKSDVVSSVVGVLTYSTPAYRALIERGGDYVTIFEAFLRDADALQCARWRIRDANPAFSDADVEGVLRCHMDSWGDAQLDELALSLKRREQEYYALYNDRRSVRVFDARSMPETGTLHTAGFVLVPHRSSVAVAAMHDMVGSQARQYYDELVALALANLLPEDAAAGCLAFCDAHVVRRERHAGASGTDGPDPDTPIMFVHNDFTAAYKDAAVSSMDDCAAVEGGGVDGFHPAADASRAMRRAGLDGARLGASRLIVLNTWRPIVCGPLRRKPLAMCDMRTVGAAGELFSEKLAPSAASLPTTAALFDARHTWWSYGDMTSDELLVFKTYDSALQPFTPTLHSAFDIEGQHAELPRVSCEARVLLVLSPETSVHARL